MLRSDRTSDVALPGRRRELELINHELGRAAGGEARLIVLEGPLGAGKTRLLREAARHSDWLPIWPSLPPDRIGTEDLLEDWLSAMLSRPGQLEARDLSAAAACYPRLASLSPIAGGARQPANPQRALAALTRIIANAAERQPLLFLIDDFPDLPEETRALVSDLVLTLAHAPVAVLAAIRDEGGRSRDDRALAALATQHLLVRIDVKPLDEEGLLELIAAELDAEIGPQLLPWLHAQSGGNTLFAVELLRELRTRGILRREGERRAWILRRALEDARVPATIAHVLEGRRRSLPVAVAAMIPALAVLGVDSPLPLLAGALAIEESAVQSALEVLADRGILELQAGRLCFAHPLMVELWGRSLPAAERVELGRRGLSQLGYASPPAAMRRGSGSTGLDGAAAGVLNRVLAYSRLADRADIGALAAIEWGRRCLRSRRVREAVGWTRRAHHRVRQWSRQAAITMSARGEAGNSTKDRGMVPDPRFANAEGVRWLRGQIDLLMGMSLYLAGRLQSAEPRLRAAVRQPEAADPAYTVRAFIYLGNLLIKRGRADEAREVLRNAIVAIGDEPRSAAATARCELLCRLVWNELDHGDLDAAARYLEEAGAALVNAADAPAYARADLLNNRGHLAMLRGDCREAVRTFRELVQLARTEDLFGLPGYLNNLAVGLLEVGELGEAQKLAEESLRLKRRVDDRYGLATSWNTLAEVLATAAEWSKCVEASGTAIEVAAQSGNAVAELLSWIRLMRAFSALQRVEEADRAWQHAVRRQHKLGTHAYELLWGRASVLAGRGDGSGSADVLEELARRHTPRSPLEMARIELLLVRTEIGRLPEMRASGRRARPRRNKKLPELAARLDRLEPYLREQALRAELADLALLRLHLAARAQSAFDLQALAREFESQISAMGAPRRLDAGLAEIAATPLAKRPGFERLRARLVSARTRTVIGVASPAERWAETQPSNELLRLWTFGPLRVIRAGDDTELERRDWGSRKARLLLACLLAEDPDGHGLQRERLLDAVWPDAETFDLERTFHVTLTFLRRALGDVRKSDRDRLLRFEEGRYVLSYDRLWCDARAFDEDLREAQEAHRSQRVDVALRILRRAFDRYEGDFLAYFNELWIEPRRERFRQRMIEIGTRLADDAIQRGAMDGAREIAERLVAIDPLAEEGHQRLIRVYSESGRREAAARQLRLCQQLLSKELGVEVSDQTLALLHP